jgi:uncharacterized membrane protein YdjX (TVP38/TMEM64 family)
LQKTPYEQKHATGNAVRAMVSIRMKNRRKWASITWAVAIFLIGAVLAAVFFRLDRMGVISQAIRSLGIFGIVLAILLMALFCVVPLTSELIMIMNMKIFGAWTGIFYSWSGAMIGATAIFLLARTFGRRLLQPFISEKHFRQVNVWVKSKGTLGLLFVRLLPLPFIVVNYTAGVLPSVKLRNYVWTTGLGILPYNLGAALIFLGVSRHLVTLLAVGAAAVAAIWAGGFMIYRRHRLLHE